MVHLCKWRRKMVEGEHVWEWELVNISKGKEESSSCEAAGGGDIENWR